MKDKDLKILNETIDFIYSDFKYYTNHNSKSDKFEDCLLHHINRAKNIISEMRGLNDNRRRIKRAFNYFRRNL